jgi:penicillin amidase
MRRFGRLALRLLGGAMLVAAVLLAATWLVLRGSLPQYDGDAHATALNERVVVERDALGTATIRATSWHDADYALGFVHAQERFFQMDLMRRRAAGELSELIGAAALPTDRTARAHRMRARLQRAFAALPDDQRDAIAAYRAGVNTGLAALSMRPFPYLLTGVTPVPWRDEDTLLVVAAMAFTLNDAENTRELAFARIHAALPESAYRFLTASGGEWDTPLTGDALAWPDPPGADVLDLRTLKPELLRHADEKLVATLTTTNDDRVFGSNGLAVGGALTGGAALVANDTHLDLRVPCLWFRTRLVYPDSRDAKRNVDATGVSLPGLPALALGSNGHVAWGLVNSFIDTADWMRVTRDPTDPTRYRNARGEWVPIERHVETIHVHDAPDETLAIDDTEWGPILSTDADGVPLALAWTAQQPGAINVALRDMERARTIDDAVAAAHASGIPPQNVVIGDSEGHIAWTLAGKVPRRTGSYDASLPVDATRNDAGWNGWLASSEVPTVADPKSLRLWSANQRAIGGDAYALLGDGGYDIGARARQLRDDLAARSHFATSDLLAIQLDDRALFLQHWKDLLGETLAHAPSSQLVDAMTRALGDWDGHASVGSVSYRLVESWRAEVTDTVFDGFAAKVRETIPDFAFPRMLQADQLVWKLVTTQPANLLLPGYADWNDLLLRSAQRVGTALDDGPGGITARTWGERNTLRLAHPLSSRLPDVVARLLDMPPVSLPGDHNMPRVALPNFGAAVRFGVGPGAERDGYLTIAGGQSGHPLSPYYGAGQGEWASGATSPFMPGPAQHTLTLLAR